MNIASSGSAQRLTTINYAFGNVDGTGGCSSIDPWADYQRPSAASESVDGTAQPGGNFNQLRLLKQQYPNLRVLIGSGFALHRDSRVGAAWLWNGTTFVTFDDAVAIGQKMSYVRSRELGGAMAWELSGDAAGTLKAMADGLAQSED